MADIDRRLQPVADRINTLGIGASTNASNNRRLQADYDRGFSDCMAARGNGCRRECGGNGLAGSSPAS